MKLQGETHSRLKLWKARSRLYRRRFLQPNTHFAAFCHFSRSSRFANLCTAPTSKFADFFFFFCKISVIFLRFFAKFYLQLLKFFIFRRYFHGFLPEFHRIPAIFMDFMELMMQFSNFPEFFEKIVQNTENLQKHLAEIQSLVS